MMQALSLYTGYAEAGVARSTHTVHLGKSEDALCGVRIIQRTPKRLSIHNPHMCRKCRKRMSHDNAVCETCAAPLSGEHHASLCNTCYGRQYRETIKQRRRDKAAAAAELADYMPEHMKRLRRLGRVAWVKT